MWRGCPLPAKNCLRATLPELHRLHFLRSMFIRHRQSGSDFRMVHAEAGEAPAPQERCMSKAVLAKYRYRRRLPHLQKADADFFITFRTARVVLTPAARDLVLQHCLREGGVAAIDTFAGGGARATFVPRIRLYAVVVMPDHVHILFSALRDRDGWPFPLVDILQCFKSATAHRINRLLHSSGPVWQEESFDHVLRSDESLKEKCEYIRQNPVRKGLIAKPENYQWLWLNAALCGAAAPGREKLDS
jgi:putative transposase